MAVADSTGVINHAHPALSAADLAAHAAASHVRLPRHTPAAPSSFPSAAEVRATTEVAYLERDRQLATQVEYDLAAGGIR
jgi:hypothetical protein